MPLISLSVVMPTHNRIKTIRYCLDSLLNQSYRHLEIVIIDDYSTDDTVRMIKSYTDPRIKCILLSNNSGAQAARNRGIREARGKWIAFQDSDDEWMPEKLEKQIRMLESTDFDPMTVVQTDCWRYDTASGEKSLWSLPLVDGPGMYPTLLSAPGPMFQGMLTSKVALEAIGLLDETVPSYQEWDTAIRLAKICRFIHIREPLFTYYLHDGDTISKDRLREIRGYLFIVEKHRNEILEYCGEKALGNHYLAVAEKFMAIGDAITAKTFFRKARLLGVKDLYVRLAAFNPNTATRYKGIVRMLFSMKCKLMTAG